MGSNIIAATYQTKAGETKFNEAALFTRPYFLCTAPDTYQYPAIAAGVGALSDVMPMEVSDEAPFLGSKFLGWGTSSVLLTLRDRGRRRWIAKSPVHADTIGGTAQQPFYLMDPLWIEAGQDISVRYTLAVGGAGNDLVRFYVEGARYFARDSGMEVLAKFVEEKRAESLHNYLTFLTTTISPVVIPAAGAVVSFVEIPGEHAFTVRKITAVTAAGQPVAAGSFTIDMFDHRGNRMSTSPMDNVVWGVGTNPEVLRQGWTIPANRRIRIVMTDTTPGLGGSAFYLTFTGAAHYA